MDNKKFEEFSQIIEKKELIQYGQFLSFLNYLKDSKESEELINRLLRK